MKKVNLDNNSYVEIKKVWNKDTNKVVVAVRVTINGNEVDYDFFTKYELLKIKKRFEKFLFESDVSELHFDELNKAAIDVADGSYDVELWERKSMKEVRRHIAEGIKRKASSGGIIETEREFYIDKKTFRGIIAEIKDSGRTEKEMVRQLKIDGYLRHKEERNDIQKRFKTGENPKWVYSILKKNEFADARIERPVDEEGGAA